MDDVVFRSLAAPGLDEDDLFAAIHGLPARTGIWGEARGWRPAPVDPPWDQDLERRRRHEELLGKWPATWPGRGPGATPTPPGGPPG